MGVCLRTGMSQNRHVATIIWFSHLLLFGVERDPIHRIYIGANERRAYRQSSTHSSLLSHKNNAFTMPCSSREKVKTTRSYYFHHAEARFGAETDFEHDSGQSTFSTTMIQHEKKKRTHQRAEGTKSKNRLLLDEQASPVYANNCELPPDEKFWRVYEAYGRGSMHRRLL